MITCSTLDTLKIIPRGANAANYVVAGESQFSVLTCACANVYIVKELSTNSELENVKILKGIYFYGWVKIPK